MSTYAKATRKTKAQRELERATEMLRKPGAALIRSHSRNPAEFQWFITPGTRISNDIAAKLIERPDVRGSKDGMWPGLDQTWRFV